MRAHLLTPLAYATACGQDIVCFASPLVVLEEEGAGWCFFMQPEPAPAPVVDRRRVYRLARTRPDTRWRRALAFLADLVTDLP